jgi:hypothetical protein
LIFVKVSEIGLNIKSLKGSILNVNSLFDLQRANKNSSSLSKWLNGKIEERHEGECTKPIYFNGCLRRFKIQARTIHMKPC